MKEVYHEPGYLENLFYEGKINDFVNVTATPSFTNEGELTPKNLIENIINWSAPSNYRYYSNQTSDPFILYEFKNKIPSIIEYSFETHDLENGAISVPSQWICEGSNSKEGSWKLLDTRDTTILNSSSRIATFHLDSPSNFKFIKFTQLANIYPENEWFMNNTFSLKHIDFYILKIPQCTFYCDYSKHHYHFLFIAIYLY